MFPFVLASNVLFYNWMSLHSFSFSHESGFISCSVYTCSITPVDLTALLIGSLFNQTTIWGLPNGLNNYCLALLMHLCTNEWMYVQVHIYRDSCTHTDMYTHCSLCPAVSLLLCSIIQIYALWIQSSLSCNYCEHIESFYIPRFNASCSIFLYILIHIIITWMKTGSSVTSLCHPLKPVSLTVIKLQHYSTQVIWLGCHMASIQAPVLQRL